MIPDFKSTNPRRPGRLLRPIWLGVLILAVTEANNGSAQASCGDYLHVSRQKTSLSTEFERHNTGRPHVDFNSNPLSNRVGDIATLASQQIGTAPFRSELVPPRPICLTCGRKHSDSVPDAPQSVQSSIDLQAIVGCSHLFGLIPHARFTPTDEIGLPRPDPESIDKPPKL